MNSANKLPALWLLVCFAVIGTSRFAPAEPADEVLTNASDVLSLSPERASQSFKILVKGVVTAAEPGWGGRFFVQDASGGVFVDNVTIPGPSPGDFVAVSGYSFKGGYAPCIDGPHWQKLGTAPMPKAKTVNIDQFRQGMDDSQRVEVSGIVRTAYTNVDRLGLELVSGAYRFRTFSPIPPGVDLQALVGAEVRVRGTAAVSFNAPLRHFLTTIVYAPFTSDIVVVEPTVANPFSEELTPLNGIAQYRKEHTVGNRVHVKGIVTYQRPGKDIFLQDAIGGLQVKSPQTTRFSPGDTVEAVGFAGVENFLPVLEDAILQKTPELQTNVTPLSISPGDLQRGLYHASFITLTGKLIDRWARGAKSATDDRISAKTTLVLQTTNFVFTAEKEVAGDESFLKSIAIGSMVEVSGICLLQSAEDGKIESVQFLLPTSNSLRVLARPSWLTPQQLSIILGFTLAVIIIAASWSIIVLKKHSAARKEAELQFKAVLAERTRLAAELHDTLGQTLTGIALQLNAAAKLSKQNPENASHHLGLARNMLRTSHVDLQRSIWDLRSRELEQFDLSRALLISGNQMADNAGIRVQIETNGSVRPLPEIIEENMLRIGQEAITNAVRHSGADQVIIKLEFNPGNVSLEIKDNGHGFKPENCVGPNDGHFGLLGMSERAKRLGGRITINSAPGMGTTVRFDLPTEQIAITNIASEQIDHEEVITHQDSHR